MEYGTPKCVEPVIKPRIIIHGGAGNITRQNLSPAAWHAYQASLLWILRSTQSFLSSAPCSKSPPTALDAAVHAVSLLESDPLFNAGIGAVFTRTGTVELEASVMVTRGYRKRGVGVSGLKHVRSPIKLASEMLKRGNDDDGGGARMHCQLNGKEVEDLAKRWGLEMCEERTFWTKKRWDEHKRDLKKTRESTQERYSDLESSEDEILWPDDHTGWDGHEYLPQGTVGAVVLDAYGDIVVATSTGGITNKLPGRIGDTPTLGAGFWAEEWAERYQTTTLDQIQDAGQRISTNFRSLFPFQTILNCLPSRYVQADEANARPPSHWPEYRRRAAAMSGTGNGDSFLRLCAVRTAAAMARFSDKPDFSLQDAVQMVAGPNGELQRSAGSHWGKTGEGEGGIIGIELVGSTGKIVVDFNRAMFRAWIDDEGREQCMVFRAAYEAGKNY